MNPDTSVVTRSIQKSTHEGLLWQDDFLAVEEPLEISIAYSDGQKNIRKNISVTMRTPSSDEELALGFLFTEGIIQRIDQVEKVKQSELELNKVTVQLKEGNVPNLNTSERNFYTTSSCGVCGKASIDAIHVASSFNNETQIVKVSDRVFPKILCELDNRQNIFEATGGLHASTLFDLEGNFQMLFEDVGRHNALDKLIGAAFKNSMLPLQGSILLLSGRASFELIQKAHMAGIRIVAAIGAPSSLAADLAESSGITLIGFLSKEKFNIYTGFDRISKL
ncbi:MAG TPA: formate dehydrogenase accessory sulfurtransferase FdhD [Dyadobacter sp.]|jgi:FdhD protein|nr:formate dehydrogenase accessory sulfurtransferase FdhD [Dyadobacter sp.]